MATATAPAAIYCRISKDEEGKQLGVDRQLQVCRDLARQRGLKVADDLVLIDNDVSAMSRKPRPAFEQLVGLLADGVVGTVVTYHADRLYRRTTDLERLVTIVEKHRAEVCTVAAGDIDLSTASGRMVARMLGAAAQGESERMGERLRMKHDELARAGKAPGGRPPFGYRWAVSIDATGRTSRNYQVNVDEADVVRTIARRILEGGSLKGIARELDAAGSMTRESRPWHPSTVRAVVWNPATVALRVHRREIAGPGDWEPILDRPTWEEVRAVLGDPARKHKRPARSYLLSGFVTNPAGAPMNGRLDRGARHNGERLRRTYATRVTSKQNQGPSMAIGADDLEALIEKLILKRTDKIKVKQVDTTGHAGADVTAIEAELNELAELRGKNEITLAEWMAARKPLQERLKAAKAAASTVRRPSSVAALLAKPGAVRKSWPDMTLEQKREVIAELIETITIKPAGRARWTPIDDRVDPLWRV